MVLLDLPHNSGLRKEWLITKGLPEKVEYGKFLFDYNVHGYKGIFNFMKNFKTFKDSKLAKFFSKSGYLFSCVGEFSND